jgi:23S rRNA-/tRNA-specific pseudouridylate synthase
MLAENMPILGDPVYFNKDSKKISQQLHIKRQLLHAAKLTILNPQNSQPKSLTAPMPADFNIK